jgi:hypothetical protein
MCWNDDRCFTADAERRRRLWSRKDQGFLPSASAIKILCDRAVVLVSVSRLTDHGGHHHIPRALQLLERRCHSHSARGALLRGAVRGQLEKTRMNRKPVPGSGLSVSIGRVWHLAGRETDKPTPG